MENSESLGHKICSQGLKPTEGKVHAIEKALAHTHVSQLESFLGMVKYFAKPLDHPCSTVCPTTERLKVEVGIGAFHGLRDCQDITGFITRTGKLQHGMRVAIGV